MEIKTKENLYTVIKNQDISECLTETEQQILGLLLGRLASEAPERKYYVVNQDEPYAHKILEAILDGEDAKVEGYYNRVKFCFQKQLGLSGLAFKPDIENRGFNRISFTFTSYPLLGKLKDEMSNTIDSVLLKLNQVGATHWSLANLERFRDISSFQDVYTGDILYSKRNKDKGTLEITLDD